MKDGSAYYGIALKADQVENDKYTKQDAAVKATVKINGTETLYELPVGTYTIQENTGWSWGGSSPPTAQRQS